MLTCQLYDLFDEEAKKVQEYYTVVKNVAPMSLDFQNEFAHFFALNPTEWVRNKNQIFAPGTWMHGLTRKEVFFKIMDKYVKQGAASKYFDILTDLSTVPMKNGNTVQISFASKILHIIDNDKPIIDQKMLLKLLDSNSGFVSSIQLNRTGKKKPVVKVGNAKTLKAKISDAVQFYDDLLSYYPKLISRNKQYLADFDAWISTYNSSLTEISDTKKIDFWMWLA